MIRRFTLTLAALPLALLLGGANQDRTEGLWRNPKNSVHVRSHRCGASMCGTVVWANDKAKADARRGGTEELVGLQLFKDFTQDEGGNWRGRVYVPDIDKTFSGTIEVIDVNTIKGSGCLIGKIGCKSQTWARIK
ncbi:Uncharacterized conserved protein, DUF2147 family [Sphingomonas laterariae]|uniref:Uncharacterized conserved protein, DUF2147 family n=1 Tax=Edaphosphingomonas laterariae TaxID=861865 RepID=A0A239FJW4_9SPHN|nr:DUF2147 domain-containing protein [Sphingomonas laterariae]SNS57186.1 Uncharacterized conserved protein, DUF2147 family [Sphingomonas laterariae]